ncbi:MAG: biotin--[acetyl-CoA-carboxylase] ligase [Ignavibacteriae bacterium]|nr:biotin--[acetyl-CoA-carboxylase] ligase [Ignavibacteriota bacterium]
MIDFISINGYGIQKILYVDSLESTNNYAKSMADEDNVLIIAGQQSAGRGRFNREWKSEKNKDVTFSLIKWLNIKDVHLVNFYTSYIVYRSIKEYLSRLFPNVNNEDIIKLKWPNDILISGKKVSGILSELISFNEMPRRFVIGVGINVNQVNFPEEISKKATSLKKYLNAEVPVYEIINTIMKYFYENLALLEQGEILMELWRLNSDTDGKHVRFRTSDTDGEISGQIVGVQDDGGIKIKISDNSNSKNISTFYSGEISFIY